MKPFKSIPALLILLYSFNCVNAQTKEETIEWIVSKLKSYSGSGIRSISKNANNQIEGYTYIFFAGKDQNKKNVYNLTIADNVNSQNWEAFAIDFDKVSNVSSTTSPDNVTQNIFINGTAGLIVRAEYKNRIVVESTRKEELSFALTYKHGPDWGNTETGLIGMYGEPNLKERMVKAFKKLAEFNNATKPKEAF